MNVQYVLIDKQMINNFIKVLYLDKFITFRDVFKMKTISYYSFKII